MSDMAVIFTVTQSVHKVSDLLSSHRNVPTESTAKTDGSENTAKFVDFYIGLIL
jgi:hypothetical protein